MKCVMTIYCDLLAGSYFKKYERDGCRWNPWWDCGEAKVEIPTPLLRTP